MTVSIQIPHNSYTYSGSLVFPYTFKATSNASIVVKVNDVLKNYPADYSISGLNNPTGGNVTLAVAPVAGQSVTIDRATPLQRNVDYQTLGDFLASQLNFDIDELWRALQDNGYLNGLLIGGQPPGLPNGSLLAFTSLRDTFASYVGRGGLYLRVNVAENAIEAVGSPGGGGPAVVGLLNLVDGPGGTYVGKTGQVVTVNSNETGWVLDGYKVGQAKYKLSGDQTLGAGDVLLNFNTLASTNTLTRGTMSGGIYTAGGAGCDLLVTAHVDINPIGAGTGSNLFLFRGAAKETQGVAIDYASSGTNEMTADIPSCLLSLAGGETCSIKHNGNGQTIKANYSYLTLVELS
jgi:hypothetical protein